MKRSKRLCALLGVFALLCVGTFALTQFEEQKEQIKNSGEIVLAVSSEEVQSLRWEYGETSLAFHRDENWLYDEDEAFPVNEQKIQNMLSPFESFGVSFVIEDVTDYGLYGLDEPECTIEFATAEQTYTVELGAYSKMDEERYVSIGDGNVYLAKVDPLKKFDVTLSNLIQHDSSLSYKSISKIQLSGEENYTITAEEDSVDAYQTDDLYYIERNGECVPLSTDRVESWLETLTTLNLTDYVTYNVTEEELESYHLVEPELTITVDYTDRNGEEQSYTLSISRDPEEQAAAEVAEANGEKADSVSAYVRVGTSQLVYRVSEYNSKNLRSVRYNDLRHKEVLAADFETVTQLDIALEGETYTLISEEGEKKEDERVWRYGEEEIEVKNLKTELMGLKVSYSDDFTDEKPSGKKELSLTVHLGHEQRPTVSIDLYRHDGEDCLAVVDDESFAFISRKDVVDLIEAVNAIVLN